MGTDQRGQRMQRPDHELVGVDTAAQFLGCSPTKVYQLGFNITPATKKVTYQPEARARVR